MSYNFEAMALKALMDGKSEMIPDLSPEYFTDKYVRMYTLCLEFFEDNKKLPSYSELSAIIDAKAPVAVKGAYQAILKNIDSIPENAEPQVILQELRNLTTLRKVDEDIEALTMAAKDKDINQVQLLLNKLHSKVNLRGITVSDMADAKNSEEAHALVRSFLDKESEDEFLGGGHSGLTIISAASGGGKALHDNTLIPTPNGNVRIADLVIGDTVYGRTGETTKVSGVFPQGTRPTYRVSFKDGRSILADAEHIWTVRNGGGPEKDMTTKEMLDSRIGTPRRDKRYNTNPIGYKYSVPLCEPVRYPEKDLVIPPYVFGAILGDGGTSTGWITFTTADQEIIEYFLSDIVEGDAVITTREYKYAYGVTKAPKYLEYLRSKDLMCTTHTKYIPTEYLEGSVEQRVLLLQGLLDTDGHARTNSNAIEFTTISERLAKDMETLVRSLGGTCNTRLKKHTSYKNKNGDSIACSPAYRQHIRFSNVSNVLPFRLKRKASRYSNTNKTPYLTITGIDYVGEESCTCISVTAQDSLYVAGSYVVTHNTVALLQAAINNYRDGKNVLFVTLELPKSVLYQRLMSNISGIEFGRIVKKLVTPEEQDVLDKAHDEFFNPANTNFFKIVDESITDAELINLVSVEAQLNGLEVCVIDYIQLVELSGNGDDWRGLSHLAKKLHKLTRNHDLTIISAAQVNSESKTKGSIVPNITTRGSRELEFSSTQFLHLEVEPETQGLIMYTKKNRIAEPSHIVLEKDFAHMRLKSTGMALN